MPQWTYIPEWYAYQASAGKGFVMVNRQLFGRYQIQLHDHPTSMIAKKERYVESKQAAFAIGEAMLEELRP